MPFFPGMTTSRMTRLIPFLWSLKTLIASSPLAASRVVYPWADRIVDDHVPHVGVVFNDEDRLGASLDLAPCGWCPAFPVDQGEVYIEGSPLKKLAVTVMYPLCCFTMP